MREPAEEQDMSDSEVSDKENSNAQLNRLSNPPQPNTQKRNSLEDRRSSQREGRVSIRKSLVDEGEEVKSNNIYIYIYIIYI